MHKGSLHKLYTARKMRKEYAGDNGKLIVRFRILYCVNNCKGCPFCALKQRYMF